MEVQDSSGKCISLIDSSTVGAQHVVRVKNISQYPKGIKVKASLPHVMQYLEFVEDGGISSASWEKSISNISGHQPDQLVCKLSRKSASKDEPLQCDEVFRARGTSQNWKKI